MYDVAPTTPDTTPATPSSTRTLGRWLEALALVGIVATFAMIAYQFILPGLIGFYRDDAEYALYGRALFEGHGYVNQALPGDPAPSRFPIGYPLLLGLSMLGAHTPYEQAGRAQVCAIGMGVAFLLLCNYFLRRHARLDALTALGLTGLFSVAPYFVISASPVMADVAYGVFGLATIIVTERRLLRDEPGKPRVLPWVATGLLVGASYLIRTAAVTLIAGTVLALLLKRRFKELALHLAGFALVALPWQWYSHHIGAQDYLSYSQSFRPLTLWQWWGNISLTAGLLVGKVPLAFHWHYLFMWRSAWYMLAGIPVSALIGLGLLRWLTRPPEGWSVLPACYLLTTGTLSSIYNVLYPFYGDLLLARLLLPVLPFMSLAMGLGFVSLRERFDWKFDALALARAAIAVGIVANAAGTYIWTLYQEKLNAFLDYPHEYDYMFRAVNRFVPKDARLIAPMSAMVTFYTGRKCYQFQGQRPLSTGQPLGMLSGDLLAALKEGHVQYIFASPEVDAERRVDKTRITVVSLDRGVPGLLEPLYMNRKRDFALFRVNQQVLDRTPVPPKPPAPKLPEWAPPS